MKRNNSKWNEDIERKDIEVKVDYLIKSKVQELFSKFSSQLEIDLDQLMNQSFLKLQESKDEIKKNVLREIEG